MPGTVNVDPYLCYKTWVTAGASPFVSQTVSLQDQFENVDATLLKPVSLCTPVDEDGQGLIDPVTRQEAYRIRTSAPAASQRFVRMVDEFGTIVVDTGKSDYLLVPTGEGLGTLPLAPSAGADYFKCYKVTMSPGVARFPKGVQTAIADQLQSRLYDVKKPTRLCTAVEVNGHTASQPTAHLMCYKVKPAPGQRKQAKVVGQIQTVNQFGPGRLDTAGEQELCVPATQTP